uniref:G-protein coupled receptors family 1 profile domain-containing protein n=1 Tax=Caenorhabditis japonica TaxID=281687 RepID=A0A8R1IR43_CAEJA
MPDHLDVIIVDIEAVLCMPPYALILLLIVWNRRKSQETTFHNHYYTLVISQGIADFAAIFIFFPVTCARAFKVGNRFIYSLGDYGAARFLATGAAYLLITRGIGVALITIQRFITLCKSHSWVERTSTVTASGGVGGTGGNQIFSDHIAIGGNLNHHRNAHSC